MSRSTTMATMATQTILKETAFKVLESVFPFDEYHSAASTLAVSIRDSPEIMIGLLFDLVHILTYNTNDTTYADRLIGRLCMEKIGNFETLEKISAESRTSILKKSPDQYTHLRTQTRICYCQQDEETENSDSE
jgi:hypothetical protein